MTRPILTGLAFGFVMVAAILLVALSCSGDAPLEWSAVYLD